MTQTDLERLDNLREETDKLKKRLNALRSASVVSATDYSRAGGNGRTGEPVGKRGDSELDIEGEILRNVLEMVEIIDKIPSEKTRKIFRRRYINQQTWSQIADELGYLSAQGPRKRMKGYKMAVSVPSGIPSNGVK